MGVALFVAGSLYSGLFFLSHVDDVLVVSGPNANRERMAGADSASVLDSKSRGTTDIPNRQASDPRFAFLLLGYGGGGHDGAYLTDSIMVVIVDPSRKALTLLSIPRDTWAPMVFDGKATVYNKLNTAYAFARDSSLYTDRLPRYRGDQGAGVFVTDTVSRLLGIPISYYVALDFQGFRQMINLVGGIDVDVPDGFSASYPANDDPSVDPSWTVVRFEKGPQHMNGERAIEYARAREVLNNPSEGSDFARARRQRLIIEAFKARLFQPEGLIHVPQLLAEARGHVDTNYDLPSVSQTAQLALDWRNVRFYQTALTNANYLAESTGPQGTYILVPDSPDRSWAPIRAMAARLWQDPEVGTAMANTEVVVENDTGQAAVATRLSAALQKLGYRVGEPASGPVRTSSQVVVGAGDEGAILVRQLEADLHVDLQQAPDHAPGGQDKITLQVGSNDARLASLAVPNDTSAPSSAVGVLRAGSWSPQVEEKDVPRPTARPQPSPSPHPSPLPTTSVPLRIVWPSATPLPSKNPGALSPTPHSATVASPSPTRTAPTATATTRR